MSCIKSSLVSFLKYEIFRQVLTITNTAEPKTSKKELRNMNEISKIFTTPNLNSFLAYNGIPYTLFNSWICEA